jgi:hypothetical protein
MVHLLSSPGRATGIAIAVLCLCTAGMTRLASQQAVPAIAPSTAVSGPRLTPAWAHFEPSVADSASPRSLLASSGGGQTVTFSTLALVIIAVVVLVLVLK